MKAFGASSDEIEATRVSLTPKQVDADFAVAAPNVTAVRLFTALISQWRHIAVSTMAAAKVIRTGLDYGVVESVARMTGLELVPGDTLRRLQIMETEAMSAWREDAK